VKTELCRIPALAEAPLLTNNIPVLLRAYAPSYLKQSRRRDAIAPWRRALENKPGNGDLAARIDAVPAQATNAYLRYAPIR
jgi:hypothetical protein